MAARIFIFIAIINAGLAFQCTRKSLFGYGPQQRFNCPQFGDSSDKIYCCGPEDNQHCCNSHFDSVLDTVSNSMGNSFGGRSTECKKETWNDNTIRFSCPMVGQSQDMIYCCGTSDNQFCCNSQDLLSIATIIGIVIAAVSLLVIVTLVCCCCCSCCLLAKRRERRGVVLVPSKPPDSNTQVFIPPQQNYVMTANQNPPYPTQASYPMQQTANYPTAPPSDHGLGYPMAPQNDQYPGGPGFKYGAQPPPYSAN